MPTYIYETIPATPGEVPERFETRQSMTDAALTHHPETGAPVRRVIVGGTGPLGGTRGQSSAPAGPPTGPCGGSCACFPGGS
ncbi:MAG: zinc ribbon domain-containing protein [Verrucomicrobiales bacterium]|nr:zinc ribbon domain-containing protein [Verrucomicrobiales bacterium]